ncbi:hypothetical protein C3941_04345 [Kaistia algarum]|uniref:dimethylsulfonioproprionate lyase family protein n=1 Tax=Kaistia algarum TaxID=2083279 RepID=UPI000CE8EB40|nr:dimethylsulfonioproprionate lyase family protein [Kaistia algarum]MCX5512552.1 dimethylsulfonioproprionate lyase family protein [Kaistia algarum]PPE81921.1 hypothetical protein C3941_04345 [Kaistia algarum]
MSEFQYASERFVAQLKHSLASRAGSPAELAAAVATILGALPAEDTPASRGSHGADRFAPAAADWLAPALSAARSGPERELAGTIAILADELRWTFGYAPDPRRPTLSDAIGFADILGKSSLLPASGIVAGLTLIAPHTYYPLHIHPAVELYLVLSGTAEWTAGSTIAAQPPGTLILHPSDLPHAMRTGHEPLLALFTWSGDIVTPSRFIE